MSEPDVASAVALPAPRKGRVRPANPYVGPRPFRKNELFFGREREASSMVNSLLSSRVMLLHSPSGAGKTSLIQTSVVPAFERNQFLVCATTEPEFTALRVNLPPPTDLVVPNRYVFSLVNGLVGGFTDREQAARMTVSEALDRFVEHRGPAERRLLVLDQLEEVLTLNPGDIDGQTEFFQQLGEALIDTRLWALLAIREDYMGGLDRFRQCLPGQLRSTFRLDFLFADAARKAVREPARKCGVEFEAAAAELLVDELRQVHSGAGGADDGAVVKFPYVEPVLLQVVCFSLFDKLAGEQGEKLSAITLGDVEAFRPFSKSIRKYYRGVLREVAGSDRDLQRNLRDWIEHHLIGKHGLRRQTRQQPPVPHPDEALSTMRAGYLIRDDPRPGGAPLWELSHDMLVGPILDDNRAWRTRYLERWQVQAEEWRASGQDRRYLLSGSDYLLVPPVRRRSELTDTERDFLRASGDAYSNQGRLARAKLQLTWYRLGLLFSMLLNLALILVIILVIVLR